MAKSALSNIEEESTNIVEEAGTKVKEAASNLKERAQELAASGTFGIRTLTKAYPFAIMGGAVAAGLLCALLIGRIINE